MRVRTLHKLTARGVATAGPGMHSDGGGLFLRVKGNGRSWVFRYTERGRKREKGLGPASAVSLAEARKRAAAAREAVTDGRDPIDGGTAAREAVTFEQAMASYITAHHQTWSNAKHSAQWESSLRRHAGPLMGLRVDQVTTADVEAVLTPIWLTKVETAGRVRQRVERILSASIARGDRPGPNPAALRDNLEHILPRQKHVVRHHAAVTVAEAPRVFRVALDRRGRGIGYQALVVVMLTASRSGEVRHMRWTDIQGDTLVIPAQRMKARRPHRVPISGPLAVFLSSLPRMAGTDLILPGTAGRPMSDMTMAKALRNAGWGDATPHGMRSTFSTWANEAAWSRDLVEDALAHRIGSDVERAYRRGDFLERRRPLMESWV